MRYFTASPVKLSLLSVCTFGYYEFYWFYRNWLLFRERTGKKISPFWRAVFSPVWAFFMFKDIDDAAQEKGILQNLHPGVLAAGFVLLLLLAKLPEPFGLVKTLAFVPVLVMNNLARAYGQEAERPDFRENGRFGVLNCLAVFFGGIAFLGSVYGFFYDGPSIAERYLENSPYGEMFSISGKLSGRL